MKVGSVMVAGEFMIAMRSIPGTQNFLNKAQRKRYILSKSKTTLQIINSKYQSKPADQLLLNGNL